MQDIIILIDVILLIHSIDVRDVYEGANINHSDLVEDDVEEFVGAGEGGGHHHQRLSPLQVELYLCQPKGTPEQMFSFTHRSTWYIMCFGD